jgi:hypothetical protein
MQKLYILSSKFIGLALIASVMNACNFKSSAETLTYPIPDYGAIPVDIKIDSISISPTEPNKNVVQKTLGYQKELLHKTLSSENSYPDKALSALNLGIFMIDINYAASYGQFQDALSCINTANKLSEELKIEEPYNNLLNSFKVNPENEDSLLMIIRESFLTTDKFFAGCEQNNVAVLVLAGSWIEELYLSTQITESYEPTHNNMEAAQKHKALVAQIGAQKESLENLMQLLENIEHKGTVTPLLARMKDLHKSFEQLETEAKPIELMIVADSLKRKDTVQQLQAGRENFYHNLNVPVKILREISAKSKAIREQIVNV